MFNKICLKFVNGNEINLDMIKQAVEIDKLCYEEDYRGNIANCKRWFGKNPYIYIMALDKNKVVGYLNVMPISETFFKIIKKGEFRDIEFAVEDILNFSDNLTYKLYLCSIVVLEEYRKYGTAKDLYNSYISFLDIMKEKRNIKVTAILADAITPAGNNFCQGIKMQAVGFTKHNSILYEKTKGIYEVIN